MSQVSPTGIDVLENLIQKLEIQQATINEMIHLNESLSQKLGQTLASSNDPAVHSPEEERVMRAIDDQRLEISKFREANLNLYGYYRALLESIRGQGQLASPRGRNAFNHSPETFSDQAQSEFLEMSATTSDFTESLLTSGGTSKFLTINCPHCCNLLEFTYE